MSIESGEFDVLYSPLKTNPHILADASSPEGHMMVKDIQDLTPLIEVGEEQGEEILVSVEGMTCQSCVRNIEGNLSQHPGVKSIKVSLEKNNANLVIDTALISPEAAAEAIDDMGFDAKLLSHNSTGGGGGDMYKTGLISVKGMTCQSCVRNIEGNIKDKPGVVSISVSLSDEEATVVFDQSVTDQDKIAEMIDDMGFDAVARRDEAGDSLAGSSLNLLDSNINRNKTNKTVVNIRGMTCHSCVNNIQANIGVKAGVVKIKVNLAKEIADVDYLPEVVTPTQIADMIELMGFDAWVGEKG